MMLEVYFFLQCFSLIIRKPAQHSDELLMHFGFRASDTLPTHTVSLEPELAEAIFSQFFTAKRFLGS